jgi:hypothetical protein
LFDGASPTTGFGINGAGSTSNQYFVDWFNTRSGGDHIKVTVVVNCVN